MEGFFKIYRRFFAHELWCERRVFSRAEAWLDLLRTARYSEGSESTLIGSHSVEIERGQLPISLRFLAERWCWSKNKVGSFIKYLQNNDMLKIGTAKGTQQTVATICNYEIYNPFIDSIGTLFGTPKGHQKDTKGTNNKKERNKEDIVICDSIDNNSSSKINNAREEKNSAPTWRTDFEIYKTGLWDAYKTLLSDKEFFITQQKFYPALDIKLTLEKACTNFWATEAGWKHKHQQRTKEINWKATFTNAISQPQNKVYKDEQRNNTTSQNPTKRAEQDALVAEILYRNSVGKGSDTGEHCEDIVGEEV